MRRALIVAAVALALTVVTAVGALANLWVLQAPARDAAVGGLSAADGRMAPVRTPAAGAAERTHDADDDDAHDGAHGDRDDD